MRVLEAGRGGELGVLKATWMNIAFTHPGVEFLGATDADLFPVAYQEGMKDRAVAIGDSNLSDPTNRSDPAKWIPSLRGGEKSSTIVFPDHPVHEPATRALNLAPQLDILGSGSSPPPTLLP